MKKFIFKVLTVVFLFITVNIVLFTAIPIDKNAYLCEYNHKIELMETVQQPRIIFIGGSNTAFGIDSKTISDSLHRNVINFGFHAGLGIRYPIEDCLQYVRRGDIVVMQLEYGYYFGGSDGEPETWPSFLKSTNWRRVNSLRMAQWYKTIVGIPRENIKGIVRLLRYPLRNSFDTPVNNKSFKYVKSGFNEFGDEVSHLNYPSIKFTATGKPERREVDKEFLMWLEIMLMEYERKGATIIMLPPVCVKSFFQKAYSYHIEQALSTIRHSYIVEPSSMALDDSCAFDTGWHMNEAGVKRNTENITKALKK